MSDPATPADLELTLCDAAAPGLPICARLGCPGLLVAGRASRAELAAPIDGRVPTTLLSLPAADKQGVSRRHFTIELAPAFCRLTSLSDQGTFLNNLLVGGGADCDLR